MLPVWEQWSRTQERGMLTEGLMFFPEDDGGHGKYPHRAGTSVLQEELFGCSIESRLGGSMTRDVAWRAARGGEGWSWLGLRWWHGDRGARMDLRRVVREGRGWGHGW